MPRQGEAEKPLQKVSVGLSFRVIEFPEMLSLLLRKVSVWKQLESGQRKGKEGGKDTGRGSAGRGKRRRKRERELLISIDFLIRFHILKCASNLRSDIC